MPSGIFRRDARAQASSAGALSDSAGTATHSSADWPARIVRTRYQVVLGNRSLPVARQAAQHAEYRLSRTMRHLVRHHSVPVRSFASPGKAERSPPCVRPPRGRGRRSEPSPVMPRGRQAVPQQGRPGAALSSDPDESYEETTHLFLALPSSPTIMFRGCQKNSRPERNSLQ